MRSSLTKKLLLSTTLVLALATVVVVGARADHTLTVQTVRPPVSVLQVDHLIISRGNLLEWTVKVTAGAEGQIEAFNLTASGNNCQGIEIDAVGRPVRTTLMAVGCANSLGLAFLNAVGGAAARLDAFEDQMAVLGLFPAGT